MAPDLDVRPIRVGIVGCGRIADAHVEQARAVGAEVVAVCDREPLMARQLADRLGIEHRHDDLAAMLAAHDLDVVHITTPPAPHPELVATAVDAGCHVFVEKPIAVDAVAAGQIVDRARRAGPSPGRQPLVRPRGADRSSSTGWWATVALGDLVHVESVLGYDLGGDYGLAAMTDGGHWVHDLPGKLVHNVLDHVVSPHRPADARRRPDGPDRRRPTPPGRRRPDAGRPGRRGPVPRVGRRGRRHTGWSVATPDRSPTSCGCTAPSARFGSTTSGER